MCRRLPGRGWRTGAHFVGMASRGPRPVLPSVLSWCVRARSGFFDCMSLQDKAFWNRVGFVSSVLASHARCGFRFPVLLARFPLGGLSTSQARRRFRPGGLMAPGWKRA